MLPSLGVLASRRNSADREVPVSGTLTELLQDADKRAAVVKDGVRFIEEEVGRKRGLSGVALKGGYKTVKRIRPGIIAAALNKLLPHFAPAIDPFYERGREEGSVRAYFELHKSDIADAMLSVTDKRAENADNRVMRRAYKGLRGTAKRHTEEAVPGLGDLIKRHVG